MGTLFEQPGFLQPRVPGAAVTQGGEKQTPQRHGARSPSLHAHSGSTTGRLHVASAVLVPAAAWLSPPDGAELPVSLFTVPMPQRTRCAGSRPARLSLFCAFFFGLRNRTTLGFLCSSGFQKRKQGSGHVLLPGAVCHLGFVRYGKNKKT